MAYLIQPAQAVGPGQNLLAVGAPPDALILNLGSGVPLYEKAGPFDMIHVDLYPYEGVDLVCDAAELPFQDDSVDGIYNESLIEHLKRPEIVLDEIKRVLKIEGKAYLVIPQVAPFHASPHDYRRYTLPGGEDLLSDFNVIDKGVRHGPVSALLWLGQEFLAMACSFGNQKLYSAFLAFFMLATFPIKFLDFIFSRWPNASIMSCTLYYLIQNKSSGR